MVHGREGRCRNRFLCREIWNQITRRLRCKYFENLIECKYIFNKVSKYIFCFVQLIWNRRRHSFFGTILTFLLFTKKLNSGETSYIQYFLQFLSENLTYLLSIAEQFCLSEKLFLRIIVGTLSHVVVFVFSAAAYLKIFFYVNSRKRTTLAHKKEPTRAERKTEMLSRVFGWISVSYGVIFVPLSLASMIVQKRIKDSATDVARFYDGKRVLKKIMHVTSV